VVPTFLLLSPPDGVVLERLEGIVEVSDVTRAVQRLVAMPTPSTSTPSEATATPQSTPPEATRTSSDDALSDSFKMRLGRLVHSAPVMMFLKGTPDAPRCGFSRKAVELLRKHDVPFGSFDILTDEEVRQGLKTYSDWPTYPQIYVRGELVGGLDLLEEMAQEETSLAEQWQLQKDNDEQEEELQKDKDESLEDRLRQLTTRHKVVLFMKGLPSQPRCGFSRQMVELLEKERVAFDAFDILQDEKVRQGLKTFSDWPTYPQLYVNGDLVGGLDIAKELAASGELSELLNP